MAIRGPNGYSNSGNGDDTLLNLEPGDYTISWENKTGWFYPPGTTETLANRDRLTAGELVEINKMILMFG